MSRTLRLTLAVAALTLGVSACGGRAKAAAHVERGGHRHVIRFRDDDGVDVSRGQLERVRWREQRADRLAADPSGALKFTKSTLTAKAGTVTISSRTASPLAHNFTVQQGTSGPVVGATPTFMGGTKTLKLKLKAGTYTFYCSVPGHRAAGMQGTLTVQ